jgi:hypothetical protein
MSRAAQRAARYAAPLEAAPRQGFSVQIQNSVRVSLYSGPARPACGYFY